MKILDKISEKIRHVQSQSEDVKVRIIWIISLLIISIIAILWVMVFRKYEVKPMNNTNTFKKELQEKLEEKVKKDYNENIKIPLEEVNKNIKNNLNSVPVNNTTVQNKLQL